MQTEFEPLLSDTQAAGLLGIHPKSLQKMARVGEIPAHRIGRFWRYRASEINAWLNSGTGVVQSNRQPARV
jgi:excisionase family DNA binding protein